MSHARFLRESALASGRSVDLRAITDPTVDSLIPGGAELIALTDATVHRDAASTAAARQNLLEAMGSEALVDAAGTIGNFEMMNRIADATGIPVGVGSKQANTDIIGLLDIAYMEH